MALSIYNTVHKDMSTYLSLCECLREGVREKETERQREKTNTHTMIAGQFQAHSPVRTTYISAFLFLVFLKNRSYILAFESSCHTAFKLIFFALCAGTDRKKKERKYQIIRFRIFVLPLTYNMFRTSNCTKFYLSQLAILFGDDNRLYTMLCSVH